jgi:Flp pilus assembly protein TadB
MTAAAELCEALAARQLQDDGQQRQQQQQRQKQQAVEQQAELHNSFNYLAVSALLVWLLLYNASAAIPLASAPEFALAAARVHQLPLPLPRAMLLSLHLPM